MTLITNQMQGSYATIPAREMPWKGQAELKHIVTTLNMVTHQARFPSVRTNYCLRTGASLCRKPGVKSLRITAFKGSAKKDESGESSSGSTSKPNHIKLCCEPEGSRENWAESPKSQNVSLSYSSQIEVVKARSLGLENLFKSWLSLLRTHPPDRLLDGSSEISDSGTVSGLKNGVQTERSGNILQAAWFYFLDLDATVKIPIMILIPSYLAVNLVYGAEVSKELIPLWVIGPLILALYIKIYRGLRALYTFSYKRTIQVVKNFPAYYSLASSYITSGKLEDVHSPVLDIKNFHYKELWKRISNVVQVWAVERYLDFMELIWPYYYRTIRFLKRAHLV